MLTNFLDLSYKQAFWRRNVTRKLRSSSQVLLGLTAEKLPGNVFGQSMWQLSKLDRHGEAQNLPAHPFQRTDPATLALSDGSPPEVNAMQAGCKHACQEFSRLKAT